MTDLFTHAATPEQPLTTDELREIFGRELTWEDVRLLHTGEEESAEECRKRLRAIATVRGNRPFGAEPVVSSLRVSIHYR